MNYKYEEKYFCTNLEKISDVQVQTSKMNLEQDKIIFKVINCKTLDEIKNKYFSIFEEISQDTIKNLDEKIINLFSKNCFEKKSDKKIFINIVKNFFNLYEIDFDFMESVYILPNGELPEDILEKLYNYSLELINNKFIEKKHSFDIFYFKSIFKTFRFHNNR